MDPPAARIAWLRMLLGVFRRRDRHGLYRDLIAETERLIAEAERERTAQAAGRGA